MEDVQWTPLVQSVRSVRLQIILSLHSERKDIRPIGREGNVSYPDLSIGKSAGFELTDHNAVKYLLVDSGLAEAQTTVRRVY